MRFTTESGAVYDLFEVQGQHYITRDCEKPIVDLMTLGAMDEVQAERVFFETPPALGERFHYLTRKHGGCVSTAVVAIEPEGEDA